MNKCKKLILKIFLPFTSNNLISHKCMLERISIINLNAVPIIQTPMLTTTTSSKISTTTTRLQQHFQLHFRGKSEIIFVCGPYEAIQIKLPLVPCICGHIQQIFLKQKSICCQWQLSIELHWIKAIVMFVWSKNHFSGCERKFSDSLKEPLN